MLGSIPGAPDADIASATENVFAWEAPSIRYGLGATLDVGFELRRLGAQRALIVTDTGLSATGIPAVVHARLADVGIDAVIWDGVEIEPTSTSIQRALEQLGDERFDGYVAVGGGSSIDTCKAINLLQSYPADLNAYVSRPHGEGRPIPGPLAPLIGVPTTAGTGSECSAISVINLEDRHVKGAISDPRLRPLVAIVDPLNTMAAPKEVAASAGYDALVQTLESYTSQPFDRRQRAPRDQPRPVYSGATPISEVWSERALVLMGRYLRRAVLEADDLEARTGMSQAALFSRLGTAGAHIPHSAAYAVAGMATSRPAWLGSGPALVPHGYSVIVTAPAAFEYTAAADPARHARAAELLGVPTAGMTTEEAALSLSHWLRQLVTDTDGPAGLEAFEYSPADVPALVAATLTQSRLLTNSPRPVDEPSLAAMFTASFSSRSTPATASPHS